MGMFGRWRESTTHDPWSELELEEGAKLALYMSPSCGFCIRVQRVMDELDLNERIALRPIWSDRALADELREARGRTTVPVLRITFPDGRDIWMPESADIMRTLRRWFAPA